MCLELRDNSTKPYNKSRFRWKAVRWSRMGNKIIYTAPYRRIDYKKGWNIARLNGDIAGEGFHVMLTRKEARAIFPDKLIKRVEVSGFLRSGSFVGRSETWKRMRFLNKKGLCV